jgi:hypothetical protein
MTTLRQFLAASVLVIILAFSVLAGEITTGIAPPQTTPTTPTAQGEIMTGIAGDIHTMRAGDISTMNADAEAAGGSVTDAAVALIQSVLLLF